MSSESIPDIGLKVDMQGYTKMRAFIGGADFWHTSYQNILRDLFKPFFPSIDYCAEDNTVVASLIENGRELISKTSPIINGDNKGRKIPQHLVEQFKQTILRVRAQMEDPRINPDTREILRNFSFPNPTTAPELYRIMGYGKKTRLFIIWGMEISPETSVRLTDIDPDTFFPQFLIGPSIDVKKTGIAALILLALTGLCFMTCSSDEDEQDYTEQPTTEIAQNSKDPIFGDKQVAGVTDVSDQHKLSVKNISARIFDPNTGKGETEDGSPFDMKNTQFIQKGEENGKAYFIYEASAKDNDITYTYRYIIKANKVESASAGKQEKPDTEKENAQDKLTDTTQNVAVANGTLTITTSEGHVRTLKTKDNATIEELRPGQPIQTSKETIFVGKTTRKRVILNEKNQLVYEGTNEQLTLTDDGQLVGSDTKEVAEEISIKKCEKETTKVTVVNTPVSSSPDTPSGKAPMGNGGNSEHTSTEIETIIDKNTDTVIIRSGKNELRPANGAKVKNTKEGEMVTTTGGTIFVKKDTTQYVVKRANGTYGVVDSDEDLEINQEGQFAGETYEFEEITTEVFEERKRTIPTVTPKPFDPKSPITAPTYTLEHEQISPDSCYITIIPAENVSFDSIKVNGKNVKPGELTEVKYDPFGSITVKVNNSKTEQTTTYDKLRKK